MPIHWAPSPPIWVNPMMSRTVPRASSTARRGSRCPPRPASPPAPGCRPVVRAARAEVRGPRGDRQQRQRPPTGSGRGQPAPARRLVDVLGQPRGQRGRYHVRRQLAGRGQQRRARRRRVLPTDHRRVRQAVEQVLDGQLDEGPLLLHHDDLVQAARELADDARFERGDHAQLEHPHPGGGQPSVVHARSGPAPAGGRGRSCRPRPFRRGAAGSPSTRFSGWRRRTAGPVRAARRSALGRPAAAGPGCRTGPTTSCRYSVSRPPSVRLETTVIRSAITWTVADPDHDGAASTDPQAADRDNAMPCRPSSSTSRRAAG